MHVSRSLFFVCNWFISWDNFYVAMDIPVASPWRWPSKCLEWKTPRIRCWPYRVQLFRWPKKPNCTRKKGLHLSSMLSQADSVMMMSERLFVWELKLSGQNLTGRTGLQFQPLLSQQLVHVCNVTCLCESVCVCVLLPVNHRITQQSVKKKKISSKCEGRET